MTTANSPPSTTSSTPKDGTSPKAAITIRHAHSQDAAAIAKLGAVVFTHSFKDSGCTAEQLQAYLDEAYTESAIAETLATPAQTTLVAVDPEEPSNVLGFALLNRSSTPSEPVIYQKPEYPNPIELQRLYVGLEAHGKGIGTALMAAAEALARKEGFETMWLGVWEENWRAQGVYAKLGYQKVGEHVFDVGGDAQTDWILVKRF